LTLHCSVDVKVILIHPSIQVHFRLIPSIDFKSVIVMSSAQPPYIQLEQDTRGLYSDQHGVYPQYPQQLAPVPTAAYYGYPTAAQPLSQQQQVVVTQAPPVVVQPVQRVQSFVAHIILSCFVFWCCGCLFGLIAFILAGNYV